MTVTSGPLDLSLLVESRWSAPSEPRETVGTHPPPQPLVSVCPQQGPGLGPSGAARWAVLAAMAALAPPALRPPEALVALPREVCEPEPGPSRRAGPRACGSAHVLTPCLWFFQA